MASGEPERTTEDALAEAVRRRIRSGMDNAQIMAEVPVSIRKIAAYRAVETRRDQSPAEAPAGAATESAVELDNPGE